MKWNKSLIVLAAIMSSGIAQDSDPLKMVLDVNPEVKAAELGYKSALENVKVAGVLPDPMLENSFSINSIETRNGPIENQIMLGQKFPLWGKLRRERNIQKIRADISKLNLENVKVKISFLLRKHLAEYSKLTESLLILENYREELETFQAIAQSQYANGMGLTQHPIIKLQIEESLVESQLNAIESSLEKSNNNLQVLFNGLFSDDLFDRDLRQNINSMSKEYWLNLAHQQNQAFAQAQALVAIASDQIKLAKLKNYPDLITGMTYSFVGPTEFAGAGSSGTDALGVKAGINIPLWFKKNRAKVKSASYGQKQQVENLSDVWNKIESDILSILKELNEINDTYKLYDESIIFETDQMLSSAYAAYETGKISFLDLLDSVRLGVKVKLEFENIKAKQTTLVARLYQTTGLINRNQENYNEN
ncbi:MAG: TolC family protein [Candidatus Neomarinimicrobiota bacterium]